MAFEIEGTNQNHYTEIWATKFFHNFPHIDFDFKNVNSTFDPENRDYQKSIIFWATVPLAVCVLLILVFLIYFMIRCCQKPVKGKQRLSSVPRIVTGLLILIGIGLIGFGFYENEKAHDSISSARENLISANQTISTATRRVHLLDDIADTISTSLVEELKSVILKYVTNSSIAKAATKELDQLSQEAKSARTHLDKVTVDKELGQFDEVITTSDDVEYYRWMTTIVLFCVYLFLLVLSLIGCILRSSRILIVAATVSVICSILIYAGTGFYLSSSVACGDLCSNPDGYVLSLVKDEAAHVVSAYVECTDPAQPYQETILSAQSSVTNAISALNATVKLAKPFKIPQLKKPEELLRNDLKYAMGNLSSLLNSVGMCGNLHSDYVSLREDICHDASQDISLLSIVCALISIVTTVLIFTLSCLWRQYIVKRSRLEYVPVDDTDPFLPGPPPYEPGYGTIVPRPWSERGSLQHSSTPEDQVMMMNSAHLPVDDSPPPAYHPGEFLHQHGDARQGSNRRGRRKL